MVPDANLNHHIYYSGCRNISRPSLLSSRKNSPSLLPSRINYAQGNMQSIHFLSCSNLSIFLSWDVSHVSLYLWGSSQPFLLFPGKPYHSGSTKLLSWLVCKYEKSFSLPLNVLEMMKTRFLVCPTPSPGTYADCFLSSSLLLSGQAFSLFTCGWWLPLRYFYSGVFFCLFVFLSLSFSE